MSKPYKLKFGGKKYKALAFEEMLYSVELNPCIDCGAPTVVGYCCTRCGSSSPTDRRYEAENTRELFSV